MRIAFIHPHQAFLPEVVAYQHFFSTCGVDTFVVKPDSVASLQADVHWHFMGMAVRPSRPGALQIHEYPSASVGPGRQLKNLAKKLFNPKPDYRLFLNDYVQKKMAFRDGVPFGFRNMGVAEGFLNFDGARVRKEYDFVYAGSTATERRIDRLIAQFAKKELREHNLLIIGEASKALKASASHLPNIHFKGPFSHSQMPGLLCSARFAINFIVDQEPFNRQASTKLLEYLALKIPVISTDYAWARDFQDQTGSRLFLLEDDLSNFTFEGMVGFDPVFPDLSGWSWENQIRQSGVLELLRSAFPLLAC